MFAAYVTHIKGTKPEITPSNSTIAGLYLYKEGTERDALAGFEVSQFVAIDEEFIDRLDTKLDEAQRAIGDLSKQYSAIEGIATKALIRVQALEGVLRQAQGWIEDVPREHHPTDLLGQIESILADSTFLKA